MPKVDASPGEMNGAHLGQASVGGPESVWRVPPALKGSAGLVRASASVDADDRHRCPTMRAVKARPRLTAPVPKVSEPPGAVPGVMDVLDRIEYRGESVATALAAAQRGRRWHPGLATYVAHAVETYTRLPRPGEALRPEVGWWVVQHLADDVRELWAWGRRYRSVDDTMREFRFLHADSVDRSRRGEAAVAIAAYVAAQGAVAPWPSPWTDRFEVTPTVLPRRVVVSEVGLLDGSYRVLFSGSAQEAGALYERVGRPAVTRVVEGTGKRPGGDCVKCRLLTTCDAVPRVAGLLGLPTYPRSRLRKVSVSDLRYYAACPAQFALRATHVPRADEYGPAARLGQAVHQFLERQHEATGRACEREDMPAGPDWPDPRWDLPEAEARLGVQMLAHHPQVCPLHSGVTEVTAEPTFAFHDTAAQALVIAKPDLVYRDEGAMVWREIKTTRQPPGMRDVLEVYPQLALGVVVLADGLVGGPVADARVELEVLRPAGSDLVAIDATDPAQIERARQILRRYAQSWREDTEFVARPGRQCRTCPVSRWCPSAIERAVPLEESADDRGARPA